MGIIGTVCLLVSPVAARAAPAGKAAAAPAGVTLLTTDAPKPLKQIASALEGLLAQALDEAGRVRVVRQTEAKALVDAESRRAVLGCNGRCQGEAFAAIAHLDTAYILVSRLDRLGTLDVWQLALVSTRTGAVAGRVVLQEKDPGALARDVPKASHRLLAGAHLLRPVSDTLPPAHYQLVLKVGNGLSRLVSSLLQGSYTGLRLDLEGDVFATRSVALFLAVGVTLGSAKTGENVAALDVAPLGFGVKHLWRFGHFRAWTGVSLGPGLVSFIAGKTTDLRTAFATSLVVGGDDRFARNWAAGLEASTSLTDAVLDLGPGAVSVPLLFGVTVTVAYLAPW